MKRRLIDSYELGEDDSGEDSGNGTGGLWTQRRRSALATTVIVLVIADVKTHVAALRDVGGPNVRRNLFPNFHGRRPCFRCT